MEIIINGEKRKFDDNMTILDILKYLKIENKAMAVAVNMEIVKKDKWNEFMPKNGDKLEILHFVGGG